MTEQMAGVDPKIVEESRESHSIVVCRRRLRRQRSRTAVTRRIPGDHAMVSRQPVELVAERACGRADPVQQHQWRAAARLQISDRRAGLARRLWSEAHAARKATVSGLGVPTTMVNSASVAPSLRK